MNYTVLKGALLDESFWNLMVGGKACLVSFIRKDGPCQLRQGPFLVDCPVRRLSIQW